MAHGQWTEIEARGALEAWKRSGLSLEAFAWSRGIVPQRLHWWKKKLRFGVAAVKESALVPVRIVEARTDARRGEPVTVLLRSGHMLKVGRDFDEQTFARVVALLERGWMLGLPPSVRIYFATELTDMRNGIGRLRARVEGRYDEIPTTVASSFSSAS